MSDELVKVERPDPPAEIAVSIIKGALGAVPVVGQALMEALFDYRSRVKQERINRMLLELAEEIERRNDLKVDFAYLRTEEFSDFLEDLMQKVATNRSEAKRKIFKDLLLSSIEGRRPVDLSKSFINILNDMTDQEMILFAKLYHINQQSKDPSTAEKKRKFDKEQVEQMGFEYQDFLIMVQNMIGKGLLYDDGLKRYGTQLYEMTRITTLGVAFYEYVTCR